MSLEQENRALSRDARLDEFFKSKKEIARETRKKNIRRFFRNKKLVFGTITLLIIIILAIFAEQIAPYSYREMTADLLQKPSQAHIMGTDNFGRDLFSRILYGSRVSLIVAFTCVAIGTIVGVPLGMIAGYVGGWFDVVIMRISDIMLSIPWILMAVTVTAILGPGTHVVIIALGLIYTPGSMRLARGLVLSIRSREYVDAAKVIGESKGAILTKYIFPNCFSPILVQTTLRLASAVLSEAAISYVGYGVQPPTPSWGLLLSEAQTLMWQAPYLSIYPGICMVILVLAGNMFGDGLRDYLDPKLRRKGL